MKKQFNELVKGVLTETNVCTPGAGGVYTHYIQASSGSQLSLFDDWITHLARNGFTLHHEADNEMQDVYLTADYLLCKVTCVSNHINVMFFNSLADLHENKRKTIDLLNKVYNR